MDSGRSTRALPRVGFPIRKSSDQRMVSSFPGLIAAAHVLHRLLAPRHPPCALVLLIRKNTCVATMEFSRCTQAGGPPYTRSTMPRARSLKTQQRTDCYVEVDVVSRRIESSDEDLERSTSTSSTPTGVRAPVSLERR